MTDQSQRTRRRGQRKSRSPQHSLTTQQRTPFALAMGRLEQKDAAFLTFLFFFFSLFADVGRTERTFVCKGRQTDDSAARRGGWMVGSRAERQEGVCSTSDVSLLTVLQAFNHMHFVLGTLQMGVVVLCTARQLKCSHATDIHRHMSRALQLSTPTFTHTHTTIQNHLHKSNVLDSL